MIAREAVLNHREIVDLLRKRFVAMAIDNVDILNMTAAEKEFLKDKGLKFSTQGMSSFSAGGELLGMVGAFDPARAKQMLLKALEKYRADEPVSLPRRDDKDPGLRRPPEGGLVLFVSWKVLGGYDRTRSPLLTKDPRLNRLAQDALGVDRLWVRKDEAAALAQGTLPESLRRRILWHFGYVYGGSRIGKLNQFDLTFRGGRLTGSYRSEKDDPGQFSGCVETRDGRVTRFELVAKGLGRQVEDCGFSAGLRMIPPAEKVPVGLLFTLADPQDELARVPPHRVDHHGYLK